MPVIEFMDKTAAPVADRNATLLDRGFDLRGRDDFVSELRGYNTRWFPCYAGDNRPINVHK